MFPDVRFEATSGDHREQFNRVFEAYNATLKVLAVKNLHQFIESYIDISDIGNCKVSFVNTIVVNLKSDHFEDRLSLYIKHLLEVSKIDYNHVLIFLPDFD